MYDILSTAATPSGPILAANYLHCVLPTFPSRLSSLSFYSPNSLWNCRSSTRTGLLHTTQDSHTSRRILQPFLSPSSMRKEWDDRVPGQGTFHRHQETLCYLKPVTSKSSFLLRCWLSVPISFATIPMAFSCKRPLPMSSPLCHFRCLLSHPTLYLDYHSPNDSVSLLSSSFVGWAFCVRISVNSRKWGALIKTLLIHSSRW